PQVILAGRRINDGMGPYVAQKLIKMLAVTGGPVKSARVGVVGLTFKENVPDIRNSRVPDIRHELPGYGVDTIVFDDRADREEAKREYGVELRGWQELTGLDAIVVAVPHDGYVERLVAEVPTLLKSNGIIIDVKSAVPRAELPPEITYWS